MRFSSRIVKPPFENRSIDLQVTRGCSHNKCKFCNYYGNVYFEISSDNEIIADLKELEKKKVSYPRVWLHSADSFTLDFEKLYGISKMIREHLPYVNSIGCYARVDSLNNKSVEQLEELKNHGFNSIVFGVETCDDYILEYMDKGYSSDDVLEQLGKMDEAKLKYTLTFLNGLGGHGYGLSHAIKTAELFNGLNPERIMINRLRVHENSRLYNDIENKEFKEAGEKECINELITFIDKLEIDTFIDATNNTNIIPFFGKTNTKKSIINKLNDELKNL
ncbi:MAG: radical SAM protein [Methanosphaera sp.]|nr:radical SAM protein [Methanosphaera sp.]